MVIPGAGGAIGIGLAVVATNALQALSAGTIPRIERVALDGWVLAFALGTTLATTVVFGLLPALRAVTQGLDVVSTGGGRTTSSRTRQRFRSG